MIITGPTLHASQGPLESPDWDDGCHCCLIGSEGNVMLDRAGAMHRYWF